MMVTILHWTYKSPGMVIEVVVLQRLARSWDSQRLLGNRMKLGSFRVTSPIQNVIKTSESIKIYLYCWVMYRGQVHTCSTTNKGLWTL